MWPENEISRSLGSLAGDREKENRIDAESIDRFLYSNYSMSVNMGSPAERERSRGKYGNGC